MPLRIRLKMGFAAASILALSSMASAQNVSRTASGSVLRRFETPYYILYTDLGQADATEADLRMTRMFEEYQRQTSRFANPVKGKFPFYLYKNEADYLAAGGIAGSAGVYMESSDGNRLMAIAGSRTSAYTWHVVQHEGFHQFVAAAIKGKVPIWANEGMAEYFGESIWTGDGFVMGLIPPDRLKEIKGMIRSDQFKPFSKIMTMTDEEWGNKLEYSNYNEAWAMVHFLGHADNGKYQPAFVQYMTAISKGGDPQQTWNKVFGNDTKAFEQRFAQWWMNLPEEPTRSGYVQAMVQTETSYFARAFLMKQNFQSPQMFFENYKPMEVAVSREFWLPPSLFKEVNETAERVGTWTFEGGGAQTKLVCVDNGIKYVGSFAINGNKVTRVGVDLLNAGNGRALGR